MPRRVEPHLYADTPIFRGMLYERDGRYPGTPEGEEDLPEVELITLPPEQVAPGSTVTVMNPEDVSPNGKTIVMPASAADTLVNRLTAVQTLGGAVFPVRPLPEEPGEKTQEMRLPEL